MGSMERRDYTYSEISKELRIGSWTQRGTCSLSIQKGDGNGKVHTKTDSGGSRHGGAKMR